MAQRPAWRLRLRQGPEWLRDEFEGALPPFKSPADYHVHDVSWEVNLMKLAPEDQ